jgi:hypothetical protein
MNEGAHINAGRMRSPSTNGTRGDTDDGHQTVQNTLDAFDDIEPEEPASPPEDGGGEDEVGSSWPAHGSSHQESIEVFEHGTDDGPIPITTEGSARALEGLALEMEMERTALSEAATGVMRDELVMTIARAVELPLERLDMVDAYITDLELEGRLRRVGDAMVLARQDDADLMDLDLTEEEFLERYRQRYAASREGAGR